MLVNTYKVLKLDMLTPFHRHESFRMCPNLEKQYPKISINYLQY